MHLELAALVVDDYDAAIEFFVDRLRFELVEDSPARTNDGRPKRWVVVRPPGAATGLLLAQADGAEQQSIVGRQVAGRVGFFLRVDEFEPTHRDMLAKGVTFVTRPVDQPYGRVAVFLDVAGNRWDLLGAVVPRRLQRSRRTGARLPEGAVVVTRPTKWGNPHRLALGREVAVRRYRDDLLAGRLAITVEDVRRELRGRDLACYCPLDQSCHADVLLEIAKG